MKKRTITILLISFLAAGAILALGGNEKKNSEPTDPPTPNAAETAALKDNGELAMGFALLKQMNTAGKNVLISPYSLAQAMGIAANGAQGETRRQLETVAGANAAPRDFTAADERVTINSANSIWGAKDFTFKDAFIAQNKDSFNAEVRSTDFQSPEAAKEINDLVSQATEGEITNIADDLSGARSVLINALYFHAPWTSPFEKERTKKANFKTTNGTIEADMMYNDVSGCLYAEDENAQRLSLPYGNGRFAMMLILPKEGGNIDNFIADFSVTGVETMSARGGSIALPRFKADVKYDLTEALKNMGVTDAFSDAADFSAMSEEKVWISRVNQAATIDVFEEGTIASAATSVIMARGMDIGERFSMVCDHPFLFMIYDTKGNIPLFIGKIENPAEVQ